VVKKTWQIVIKTMQSSSQFNVDTEIVVVSGGLVSFMRETGPIRS